MLCVVFSLLTVSLLFLPSTVVLSLVFAHLSRLRDLADKGHTIICILHQPRSSVFQNFDRVFCLAQGGIPAYSGPPKDVRLFAESCGGTCPQGKNPADHLIDLVSGRVQGVTTKMVTEACKTWSSNPSRETKDSTGTTAAAAATALFDPRTQSSSVVGVVAQLYHGFLRSVRQQMRDSISTALYVSLCVLMMASLSVGFSPFIQIDLEGSYRPPIGAELRQFCPPFMGDSCGAVINSGGLDQMLFFFSMSMGCIGMVAASRSFDDAALLVMKREAEVGLNTAATLMAKMCADLIQILLLGTLSMGLWVIMGFPGGQFRWLLIGCGLLFTTYGWGYLVSQVTTRAANMTASLVVAVVLSALNGVNPKLAEINQIPVVNWLWSLSYSRWIAEAMYFIFTKHHMDSGLDVQHGADELGFVVSESQFSLCIGVVFLHGVVLRLIAGALIVSRVKKMEL